jgi:hypothetical protein
LWTTGVEFENVDKKWLVNTVEGGIRIKTLSDGVLSAQNPSLKKVL